MRHANWVSLGIMVTFFAWMAHRLEFSRRPTRYASEASCRAIMAPLWNRMFILPRSWAISLTSRWNGSFLMSSSVIFDTGKSLVAPLCPAGIGEPSACPAGKRAASSCLSVPSCPLCSSSLSSWAGLAAAFGEPCCSLVASDGFDTRHRHHCLAEGEDVLHVSRHFGDSPPGRELGYIHATPPSPSVIAWYTLLLIPNSSHSNYGISSNYGLKSF